MFRYPVLCLATLLSSTALWSAFVDQSMPIQTALLRFLIALPIAALMVSAFLRLMQPGKRRAVRAAMLAALAESSQDRAEGNVQSR